MALSCLVSLCLAKQSDRKGTLRAFQMTTHRKEGIRKTRPTNPTTFLLSQLFLLKYNKLRDKIKNNIGIQVSIPINKEKPVQGLFFHVQKYHTKECLALFKAILL